MVNNHVSKKEPEVKNNEQEKFIDNDIVSIFNLLAQFDYEDKQKEKLVLNSDLLVSAPRKSEFGPNS